MHPAGLAWLAALRGDDWRPVRAVLDEAASDADALADPGVQAELRAAAELIAAGRGRPSRGLPAVAEAFLDRVDGWPSADDARRAADLLARLPEDADHAELVARLRW